MNKAKAPRICNLETSEIKDTKKLSFEVYCLPCFLHTIGDWTVGLIFVELYQFPDMVTWAHCDSTSTPWVFAVSARSYFSSSRFFQTPIMFINNAFNLIRLLWRVELDLKAFRESGDNLCFWPGRGVVFSHLSSLMRGNESPSIDPDIWRGSAQQKRWR